MTPDDILMVALAAAGTDRGVRTDAQRMKAALAAVAPLIADAEREACAKVADAHAQQHADYSAKAPTQQEQFRAFSKEIAAGGVAAAIRARSDKP